MGPSVGGLGALAANVGPLERPGGYQRLTYGQPSVNVRSTFGQRSVSSLAIAGRFSLILPDSSIKTEDRRTCISQMVDFPIRKRDFRVRTWSGAFWEPLERKKEKTKCIYRRVEKKLAPERRFFIKKETLLLEGALVYLRSWERMRGLSGPSTFDQ